MDGGEFNSNIIIDVPYDASFAPISNSVTVMAWVKRSDVQYNVGILSHDYPAMFFGFHNSLYKWEFPTDTGESANCYAGYTPQDKWVHIAATYDGTTARLFANGVEVCTENVSGNIIFDTTNPNFSSFTSSGFYEDRDPLSIPGYNQSGVTDEVNGKIDELKVYNKALGAEEIRVFYNLGTGVPDVNSCPEGTITAQYKIGTGSWVTGNNINATEGEEIYIRANTTATEYLITIPEINGNTLSSIASGFIQNDGYKLNTNTISRDNDGEVSNEDSGQYVLTTIDGCIAVINLNVAGNCAIGDTPISAEWRIGGAGNSYLTGNPGENVTITAGEGQEVRLSITPNSLSGNPLEYKLIQPNGSIVENLTSDYTIANAMPDNTGVYLLESEEGCSVAINLTVNQTICSATTMKAEWSLDGGTIYNSAPDNLAVSVDATIGDNVLLSMIPNNINFTVTYDGVVVYDGQGDYTLGNVEVSNSGNYIINAVNGCASTITLNVINPTCNGTIMKAEWSLDGGTTYNTAPDNVPLTVNASTGDNVLLSMAPNGVAFTITNGGTVVYTGQGDYTLGSVTASNSGDYILSTEGGCVTIITLTVADSGNNCSATNIIPEYRIDGSWASGQNDLQLSQGTSLMLSMLPNGVGVSIKLPNGEIVGDDYNLGSIDALDSGQYVLTSSEGCVTTITLSVIDTGNCSATSIIPEYRIDGSWASGLNDLQLSHGTSLMLSMLPNGVGLSIKLPNGQIVGDNYNLGSINALDAGQYVLTSSEGCSTTINLSIAGISCSAATMKSEWSLDGGTTYSTSPDNAPVTVNASTGEIVLLSMAPSGIDFTISRNGTELYNGQGDYALGSVTAANSGNYIINSVDGCSTTITLTVTDSGNNCSATSIIPEYRIDGSWASGQNDLQLSQGTSLMLSMLPNGVGVSIELPNGEIVGDNYNLGSVDALDAGQYVLTSEEGCSTTITLVVSGTGNCSATSIIPEYRIDGAWASGQNDLQLSQGTSLMLSMLPNGVGVSIKLPNGEIVGDNYNLGSIDALDAGQYVLTSSEGCTTLITLSVLEGASLKLNSGALVNSLSIDQELDGQKAKGNSIFIYPNPTKGKLNIDLSSKLNESLDMRVINSSGQVVYFIMYNKNHKTLENLDLGGLDDGIYHITFEGVNFKTSKSVILKK